MERKDYVMRVIHQFIDRLLKILKLREEGKYDDALKEIESACESYLGLNPHIVDLAPDVTLLSLLTIGKSLDAEKCLFLAKLLKEQGQILEAKKEESKSYWSYTRSLRLYIESMIAERELMSVENLGEVDFVLGRLAGVSLSPELEKRLADFRKDASEVTPAG